MKNSIVLLLGSLLANLPEGSQGFQQQPPPARNDPFGSSRQQSSTKSSTQLNSLSIATVDTFFETQPYIAAFMLCSFKASAADALAQNMAFSSSTNEASEAGLSPENETEMEIDLVRNLSFILYGGLYQGMGQTFLYSHLYPFLFGAEPTVHSVLAQASMENFVLAPFLCLPTVYTIKSLLQGNDVQAGLEKYWDHIFSQQILFKYWSIWFPVGCFNFGVVPEHLRVPFGAFVSFFWVCILSTVSAKETSSVAPPMPNTKNFEPPIVPSRPLVPAHHQHTVLASTVR